MIVKSRRRRGAALTSSAKTTGCSLCEKLDICILACWWSHFAWKLSDNSHTTSHFIVLATRARPAYESLDGLKGFAIFEIPPPGESMLRRAVLKGRPRELRSVFRLALLFSVVCDNCGSPCIKEDGGVLRSAICEGQPLLREELIPFTVSHPVSCTTIHCARCRYVAVESE
jgi:hypothetical protein